MPENSIFIPSGPPVDPKTVDLKAVDPFYAGDIENIEEEGRIAREAVERERRRAQQLYEINRSQISASSSGGGDYGLAAAARAAELEREKAAHDDVNFRENMRERLASRGALDSGQFGWENKEQDWQLAMMNKQIEADLEARQSAAAAARADAQARIASQLSELSTRHQWNMEDFEIELGPDGISRRVAKGKGQAALDSHKRLTESGYFLPKGETAILQADGTYMTRDGRRFNANGDPILPGPAPSVSEPSQAAGPSVSTYEPAPVYRGTGGRYEAV